MQLASRDELPSRAVTVIVLIPLGLDVRVAFLTLVNALTAGTNPGLTLPQREARRALAEQVLRREGLSISVPSQ